MNPAAAVLAARAAAGLTAAVGWAGRRLRGLACLWAGVVASVVTIALRDRVPVEVRPGMRIDDLLFVRNAVALADDRWLGPVNQLTLSKGIGYPAFIAWTDHVGLQLKPAEQILYLLAALSIALTVLLLTRRPIAATVVYVVLAFSPLSFGAVGSLVAREGFYASLTLLLIGTAALTVLSVVQNHHPVWTLLGAAVTGLVLAAFSLTREETVWIAPALLLLVVGLAVTGPRAGSARAVAWRVAGVGVAMAVAGGISTFPVRHVEQRNLEVYGVKLANDTTQGEFARMYTDWSSVRVGEPRQYVPISAAAREAVYAVSPSAREIREKLERAEVNWFPAGCGNVGVCDDFTGGFMLWALRDATWNAGSWESETQAQAFFGQIANDIEKACREGTLTCDTPSNALSGLLAGARFDRVWDSTWRGFDYVVLSSAMTKDRVDDDQVLTVAPEERRLYHQVIPDVPTSQTVAEAQIAAFSESDGVYAALTGFYRLLLPVLLATGLAGFAVAWVRRTRADLALAAFVLALAGAAMTRLVVLAVVDTTAFAASTRLYQGVTYALVLATGAVGTVLLADVVKGCLVARRDEPDPPPDEAALAAAVDEAIGTDLVYMPTVKREGNVR